MKRILILSLSLLLMSGCIGFKPKSSMSDLAEDTHGQLSYTTTQIDTLLDQVTAAVATSAGAGDTGKLIELDAAGKIDSTFVNDFALGEDADVGDYDITSIDGLYGYDAGVFIDMGADGRIVIQADGAGTPFSTPDIDITGTSYFDADTGFPIDTKIYFGDTLVFIESDDDGYLDLDADTGIRFNGTMTTTNTYDATISTTTAGGETGLYSYITHITNALTGELIGVRGNARVDTIDSASGTVMGGKFQAGNMGTGTDLATATGVYVDVVNKIPSGATTWTNARGYEVSMDLDQGSAGNTNTITNAYMFYGNYNLPTAGTYTTVTNGYGIYVKNEAVGGTGQMLDAAFYASDASMSGGIYGWDYGLDFSGIASGAFGTADIRGVNGETISNNTDGSWDISTANLLTTGTLGNASNEIADIYLADGSIIYFGNDQDVTLTHNADTGLTLNLAFSAASVSTSGNITSGASFIIGAADITEAELEILDGATLSTTDINIIDGISDSGSLTAAELRYVDGVTSAIQTQIDAKVGNNTGSSTDNAVPKFHLAGGYLLQNTGVLIDDSNNVTVPGTITVGSSTINMSSSNGTLTILGAGDGQDEDLSFDFNTTADTVGVSSSTSVGLIDFGAIAINSTQAQSQYIPISDMDITDAGADPPTSLYSTDTNSREIKIATFDGVTDENLSFIWPAPSNLTGTTIKYRWHGIVTNATGPSSEAISFQLSCVSVADGEQLDFAAYGTAVATTEAALTEAQDDLITSAWSSAVTPTGLAAGEMVHCLLNRDADDADTYGQDFGLIGIDIKYQYTTNGLTF